MLKMERYVRTIYMYLFALLGLIFLSIGSIRLLDMGLRTWIFTEADSQERLREMPPVPAFARSRLESAAADGELTAEEREQVRMLLQDYDAWRERADLVDPVRARRHRDAASSLAMILVGLPLYLYHWRRIRQEAVARRRTPVAGSPG